MTDLERWTTRHASAVWTGLFLAVWSPVLFGGRTNVLASWLTAGISDPRAVVPRSPEAHYVDIGTPAFYEWPINRLVGQMWRDGEFPLWNPYQGAGTPLLAQYSSRAYFPYQILEDLAPESIGDHFLLGRPLLAGLLTIVVARRLGVGGAPALLAALIYGLGGTFSWFLQLEQMANVALMLPLLVLTLDDLAEAPAVGTIARTALATGLVLLAGQPETALYALAFGGLFWLWRAPWFAHAQRWKALAKGLAGYWAAALLGIALAAPLLIPFAELMAYAYHIHRPDRNIGTEVFTSPALAPGAWVPGLLSASRTPHVPSPLFPDTGFWDFLGGSVGLTPFLLVALALHRGWTRWHPALALFAGASATILLKNVGIPPFLWIGHLPAFDMAWSPRWAGPIWCFGLAIAAAVALESRREAPVPWMRTAPAWIAAGIGLVLLCGMALSTVFAVWLGSSVASVVSMAGISLGAAALVLRGWYRPEPSDAVAAALVASLAELLAAVPMGRVAGGYEALPAGLVLACGFLAIELRDRRVLALAIPAAGLGFVMDRIAPEGLPDRRDPYVAPPFVRFLQEQPPGTRIAAFDGLLYPNQASAFGLEDVRYITALSPMTFHRYTMELMRAVEVPYLETLWFTGVSSAPGRDVFVEDFLARRPYWALAGVKHVVVRHGRVAPPDLRVVYSDAEVDILEDATAIPRATLPARVSTVSTPDEALAALLEPGYDPAETTIVESARPQSAARGTVTPLSRGRQENAWTVVLDTPGILRVTDTLYPGWVATIDGVETPILAADLAFRAVEVPAGTHEVRISYAPALPRYGLLAWIPVALVGLGSLPRRRTREQVDDAASAGEAQPNG